MALFTPYEVVYNYGGLAGKQISLEGTTYTIDYVKTSQLGRLLAAHMTNNEVIILNQDEQYDFVDHVATQSKAPTKPKVKGKKN